MSRRSHEGIMRRLGHCLSARTRCCLSCSWLSSLRSTIHRVTIPPVVSPGCWWTAGLFVSCGHHELHCHFSFASFGSHVNTFLLVCGSGIAAPGGGVSSALVDAAKSSRKYFNQFPLPSAGYGSFFCSASSPAFRTVRFHLCNNLVTPLW